MNVPTGKGSILRPGGPVPRSAPASIITTGIMIDDAADRIGWHAGGTDAIIGHMSTGRTHRDDAAPTPADGSVASRAARIIESDPALPHTLDSLARAVATSTGQLRRAFVERFGMTPAAYARAVRAGALRELLRAGSGVAHAGYSAGFGSDRAIYEHGSRALGMSPSRYRKGGAGLTIAWDLAHSPLGDVLVGATETGVCCVLFIDDEDPAELLAREFPRAELTHDPDMVRPHLEYVSALLRGEAAGDVPLDLIGTPFQRKVWAELRAIPPGSVATYAQIAERIGSASAVRAVAGACANNHAALVVPCHRVIRTDGGMGGYKWGVERKRRLLEQENRR